MTQEDLIRSRQSFEKAIGLDPNYATAYTELAFNYLNVIIVGCSPDPSADLERAFQFARRGIELDPTQGMAYICLARLYMQKHDFDNALLYAKKAVQLEPNGTITLSLYAHILEASGKPGEALPQIDRTIRLGPRPEGWWYWLQALCLNQLGRHEESIAAMKRHLSISPNALFPQVFLVSLYMSAGQQQLAKAQAAEVMKIDPAFSVDTFLKGFNFYKDPSTVEGYAQNMRRAGLPE
jgi:tetratricopeptide (TPR) repeat protein